MRTRICVLIPNLLQVVYRDREVPVEVNYIYICIHLYIVAVNYVYIYKLLYRHGPDTSYLIYYR